MKTSILVIDFEKPEETKLCLESIQKFCSFNKEVIYLNNGSQNQDYAYQFFKDGLVDEIILRKSNSGCGLAIKEAFLACQQEYAILMQNDQSFIRELSQFDIDSFIYLFKNKAYKIGAISFAGLPAGHNTYSERAHIISVPFYNSIPKTIGGPGPWNNIKYSEQSVQEYFHQNDYKFIDTEFPCVIDNGKWSVREIGDGKYKHRCDTKQMYILKKPTYKTEEYPPFNDKEWEVAINGHWIDGSIPEKWQRHSFVYWKD